MEMLVFMVLRGTYLRKKSLDRGNVVGVFRGVTVMFFSVCVTDCFVCIVQSVELTRGYMTNDDLEKAMKDFTKRCSKISRLYR